MKKIFTIVLICVLGVLIYSNTLHSPFHFDDNSSIGNNSYVKNLHNLKALYNYFPTRFTNYLSLALNYRFGRLNVFGYHVVNLIIHIGAAIMAWWLTLLTLRTPAMKGSRIAAHSGVIATFAGLAFVSHPIQTQGVTYICQRTASLATLFYLSSVALYVKSRLSGRVSYYAISLICLILGMFTKEMTVTIPLMILLYEYCFLRESNRVDWRPIVPFIISLLIIPATMFFTKSVNFAEMRLEMEIKAPASPWEYLLTQSRAIVTYMRLLLVPIGQNLDYDFRISKTIFEPSVLLSFALIIIVLTIAIKLFPRQRLVSFGVFWFFLTLLPESSIIPFRDVIFEHRLYLPMAGFAMFLTTAVYGAYGNKSIVPVIAILSVIVALYSMLAYNRNAVWKDGIALWNDTIGKSPNKARPYSNRGLVYKDKGDFDHALSDYNKALEISPDCSLVYYNRGLLYQDRGDLDRALADYYSALKYRVSFKEAYVNRGNVYLMKADADRAISDYNKALEIRPDDALAFYNRAMAYEAKKDIDKAVRDFDKAIEFNPDNADAYNNRANAYQLKSEFDRAILDYDKAIAVNPVHPKAYVNRAIAYFHKKEYVKARADVRKARDMGCEVNPNLTANLKMILGSDE